MDIISLYDNYNSYFNADLKAIFEQCSKIAFNNHFKIYLIGGLVRDLILNSKSLDIDITVEGNAIKFAQILEKENAAQILSIHEKFGTAKVKINGQNIDLASTRNEYYPHAGHLPVITEIGCPLQDDILRRDFTINSLAMSLNKENFCELKDFVNGLEDLKTGKIKILHNKSFIDDPTRILRGLKYASRLGFELDKNTLKLQQTYLDNINYDMCYKRIKQEFVKTFNEATSTTIKNFLNQNIYKLFIKTCPYAHPNHKFQALDSLAEIFTSNLNGEVKHTWLIYFGVFFHGCDLSHFNFTKYENEVLACAENLINQNLKNDFELFKIFRAQKPETLLIIAMLGKDKEVSKYLKLQNIAVKITGKDLLKEGYTPSKKFSEVFDYILKEKIKNPNVKYTKQEELTLAKAYLS